MSIKLEIYTGTANQLEGWIMGPKPGFLLTASLTLLLCSSAAAGDFMDMRLTWSLSDANLLASPGETADNTPGPHIGSDGSLGFFDNYETKYTGFETLGHLVLYKEFNSFFDYFSGDSALFLGIQPNSGFADEGSYIRVRYDWSKGTAEGKNLELTLFPLEADRLRLGYSYRISWGGSDIFQQNYGLVPGAKLQLNLPWGYAYAGFKTTIISEYIDDTEQTEQVANYGALAGLGGDWQGFVLEMGGGYFTRGTFAHEGVRGRKLYTMGLSYQVGYHEGLDIGRSVDFELYRNDPYMEQRFFAPETYDEAVSFRIMHEGNFLRQPLEDPEQLGELKMQMAWAFDINAAIKWGYWRLHLDAVARSLSYILHEVPSFTPYQAFDSDAASRPELWAAIGLDHHFPGPRLTPGIKFGIMRPATYWTDVFGGPRRVVVMNQMHRSILPLQAEEHPIYTAKASLRWDFAEALAFVAELYYSYDDNQIRYTQDFYGLNLYSVWADPHVLGFNLLAQARY